ncbi:MAG TPA: response regulator transcription factor, partial [Campylobacterales bacterium]|nr:response regulator transcription factor [Campylobacterales bacterium]
YMIIVSAHTDTKLLLEALHQGVDRYIVKPMDEHQLFESFDAYLEKREKLSSKEIDLGQGLLLNLDKSQVKKDETSFSLSRKESLLLKLLVSDQHKAFSYAEIEYHVWGSKSMSLSALRTVVRDLRKKLGSNYLNNVSGVGYSFI